jgi:hypothetical protein
MEFIIVNYRLGGKRVYPSQVIVQPKETSSNPGDLLGKSLNIKISMEMFIMERLLENMVKEATLQPLNLTCRLMH